eukprot:6822005-Ditylum_brightwellii.AAC.1
MVAKYDPDVPTYWQAMAGDKAEYLFKAMNGEIDNLIKCKAWEVTLKSDIGEKFLLGKSVLIRLVLKKK